MTRSERADASIAAAYPLTALQEGMLFHTIREPSAGAYITQYTATLRGALEPSLFRRAWHLASERHEPLRTFFTWEGRERPLQVVRRHVDLPVEQLDWTDLDAAEQQRRWATCLADDRARGLDIARAPVMRFTLVRLGAGQWRFLWTVFHALLDGWSGRVVLNEVYQDYSTLARGQVPERPPAASFGDYVHWLSTREQSAAETFWRASLAGVQGPTPLPATGGLPSLGHRHWPRATRHVSPSLASALEETARRHRVTVNTVTLAAWALLLARHAGRDEAVVGTTLTVRPPELPRIHEAAGLYLNTLPVRLDVNPAGSVSRWLADVQARQAAVREFDYTSLSDVQRWSPLPGAQPLFESLVVHERFPDSVERAAFGDAIRVDDRAIVEHSNYPLALLVVPADGIDLLLVYDSSRYDESSANRLLARYARVLEAIANSSDGTVGDLVMLPESEQTILRQWSDSSAPHDDPSDVMDLFGRAVQRHPTATAVLSDGEEVSYSDLDTRANRLARRLEQAGAGRDALMALLLDRSLEFVTAMLAALKLGAAYVPLDTRTPAARRRALLEALSADWTPGPLVLVTRVAAADNMPPQTAVIDLEVEDDRQMSSAPLSRRAEPGAAAYVIHTSGSTGLPKGVVVERRQLAWSTAARFAYYPRPVSRFLLLSPVSVDSATAGLYWTLCSGGTLVLPPDRVEQDPRALLALVNEARVSHMLLVPSLYRAILDALDGTTLESVECVVVAGEACSPEVVRLHREVMGHAELHNEYGPSEATVWATATSLTTDERVTIGRPVPGARVYLLDGARRRVPMGVPGEIVIGGQGVARGYLGQDEQTERRFIPDPFVDGQQVYLTGDRGRYLADGRIEFLGRVDDQLKVRGYRVEPAEIERMLEGHPNVREAAVAPARPQLADDPEGLVDALLRLDEAAALSMLEST